MTKEQIEEKVKSFKCPSYFFCVVATTGYTYEQIQTFYSKELLGPKYFKCGRYMESLKDKDMGKYEDSFILASTNQRFLVRIEDTHNYQSSESHIMHI